MRFTGNRGSSGFPTTLSFVSMAIAFLWLPSPTTVADRITGVPRPTHNVEKTTFWPPEASNRSGQGQGLVQGIVLEGASHSLNFMSGGTDLQCDSAPRGGRNRHFLENQPRFRKGKREVIRRGFEEINRAGTFIKIDVRREHPRLQICRNGNRDYRFGEIRDYAGDRPRWRPRR